MNKEALPLISALLVPLFLVSIILLHFYGYDITIFFRKIDIIYYIIILPIVLGLLLAIMNVRKQNQ